MVACLSTGDEEWDDGNEQNVLEVTEQDNETTGIKQHEEEEEEEEELQRAFSRHSEGKMDSLNTSSETSQLIMPRTEYVDMVYVYGFCDENINAARREYAVQFPRRRLPDKKDVFFNISKIQANFKSQLMWNPEKEYNGATFSVRLYFSDMRLSQVTSCLGPWHSTTYPLGPTLERQQYKNRKKPIDLVKNDEKKEDGMSSVIHK
ncbi:hypothetical protein WN51_00241 [Melipona quadrifasciata]|uniref:DUF4817 domain-containing protein n=1 Tax=Melipona quadrifasciata TaxID=166423 RepID=A0A0N0BG64_9HYME|nr:hypothetical protein WN51_00241 [Melipona quadrifasciata]